MKKARSYLNQLVAALLLAVVLGAPILTMLEARAQAPKDAPPPAEAKPAAPPAAAQPAPAAVQPPPGPAPEGAPARETLENPYGLEALWKQGDFVSRGTLIILIIMSMGSWYIMSVKVYEQAKLFRQAK